MSKTVNASKVIGLLVLLMAALVMLSATLVAPDAEAKKKKKKKKHHRPPIAAPAFNVVQCPDGASVCVGTEGNDFLIGTDGRQTIEGKAGIDVYNGKNGGDFLKDNSTVSSDAYLFPATEFGGNVQTLLADDGGDGDVVDLRSYSIDDFEVRKDVGLGALFLDGPGKRAIGLAGFFNEGKIETFLFREGAFTGDDVASRIE